MNSPPRPGFTRTGKSLKAVRRYYALKAEAARKRQRSPTEADPSKRRKDDLSKRIAAEIHVQQEIKEKRAKDGNEAAAEKSQNVLLVQESKNNGPTFVSEPKTIPKENSPVQKSARSAKSIKSGKSVIVIDSVLPILAPEIGPTAMGCYITCIVLAVVYFITWMVVLASEKCLDADQIWISFYRNSKSIRWLGITSILVIGAIPLWIYGKSRFRNAFLALAVTIVCGLSLTVHFIYLTIFHPPTPLGQKKYYAFSDQNPLNFWLSITYLVFLVIAITLMVKYIIKMLSKEVDEKSQNKDDVIPQLSLFLAPNAAKQDKQ